jgi:preprotein translocase subunit YajC
MSASGNMIQSVVSTIALGAMYAFVFWRVAKREKNKVIEFGGLALGSVFVLAAAMKIPALPDWILGGLVLLFFLLSFLMMFFLLRQGLDALRRRKQARRGTDGTDGN